MKELKNNLLFNIIVFAFSVFFLIFTFKIPVTESNDVIGPRGWPMFLLILMGVPSLIGIIKALVSKKSGVKAEKEVEKPYAEYRFIIVAFIMALYILLIPIIGFTISTGLLVFTLAGLLGMKNVWKLLITASVSALALNYIFVSLLLLPLPKGMIF